MSDKLIETVDALNGMFGDGKFLIDTSSRLGDIHCYNGNRDIERGLRSLATTPIETSAIAKFEVTPAGHISLFEQHVCLPELRKAAADEKQRLQELKEALSQVGQVFGDLKGNPEFDGTGLVIATDAVRHDEGTRKAGIQRRLREMTRFGAIVWTLEAPNSRDTRKENYVIVRVDPDKLGEYLAATPSPRSAQAGSTQTRQAAALSI